MLTGEKPFTGEQLTTVVYKIVAEEPVPPHRLNSTLNQQITNVLRRALAKKPDARYFFTEIRGCARGAMRRAQGMGNRWRAGRRFRTCPRRRKSGGLLLSPRRQPLRKKPSRVSDTR